MISGKSFGWDMDRFHKKDLAHVFSRFQEILEYLSWICALNFFISHTFQCKCYISIACTRDFIMYALGPFSRKQSHMYMVTWNLFYMLLTTNSPFMITHPVYVLSPVSNDKSHVHGCTACTCIVCIIIRAYPSLPLIPQPSYTFLVQCDQEPRLCLRHPQVCHSGFMSSCDITSICRCLLHFRD